MEAARVHKKGGEYKVDTIPIPIPIPKIDRPTDVIIQIKAASLCHTDFRVRDGVFGDNFPIIGSHEAVGVLYVAGSEVTKFKQGDRIGTFAFQNACGKCPDCEAGLLIYCDNLSGMGGVTTDGGFAGL